MTQKKIITVLEKFFLNCRYTHCMIYQDGISAIDGGYIELGLFGVNTTGIVRVYKEYTTIEAYDNDSVNRLTIIKHCIINKRITACGVNGRTFTLLIENSLGVFRLKINCTDKNTITYELC